MKHFTTGLIAAIILILSIIVCECVFISVGHVGFYAALNGKTTRRTF